MLVQRHQQYIIWKELVVLVQAEIHLRKRHQQTSNQLDGAIFVQPIHAIRASDDQQTLSNRSKGACFLEWRGCYVTNKFRDIFIIEIIEKESA
jgi:hypothetical protein